MKSPDVIVIGTGPCGAVAAAQLAEQGLAVIVLEAGPRPVRGFIVRAAGNTVARWAEPKGMVEGSHRAVDDPATQWYRSITVGGVSNYWTAAVPRMAPDDFTEGAALDERYRWPVTYDELVPYYAKVEKAMTITAGDAMRNVPAGVITYPRSLPPDWAELARTAQAAGHGVGVIPLATGSPYLAAARPTGWNSYHCVLKPLVRSGRVELVRDAIASRLLWSPSAGRVTGVEYLDGATKEVRTMAARAVMVAGGTLNSTRLLLRSRSEDFPTGLGNTHDLVGRYLHDHPREWWPAELDRPMRLLAHPVYIARADLGVDAPLMATSHTLGLPNTKARVGSWLRQRSHAVGVQVFGTMVPTEDHVVRLTPESATRPATNPFDDVLEIGIHYDEQARRNMVDARERFRTVMAAGGLPVRKMGPFHELIPGSSVHYSGTARMHSDPRYGVLDAWNRVHDVPNVAVCDMSAFPTGPEKNPTLTAMALAVRAAERIGTELKAGRHL